MLNKERNYYFPDITGVHYDLEKLKKSSVLLMTHLGLGDQIILNGLVNFLSKKYEKLVLPVQKSNFNTLKYLYSENNQVDIVEFPNDNKLEYIENYRSKNNIEILQIGFQKVGNTPFNISFYNQIGLPYKYSYDYYCAPSSIEEEAYLEKHLLDYYNTPKDGIVLVHNESSKGIFNLDKVNLKNPVYITKESDKFNNLLYYSQIIKNSKEIHCLDSSFLHLVERTNTNAKLYFHDLFGASIQLSKNWYYIGYEH
jgi:hypothetical protein